MLTTTNTGLLVVDIQGKLARLVEERRPDRQHRQVGGGGRLLGLPVVWLEQNPDKLGATVPELQLMQAGDLVLPKHSFGALGNRRWPTPSPVRASATGWCAASRPIFASTRRCRDCWTRAARCRWWWMRCRRAAPPTGSSPSTSWRHTGPNSPRWRCASTSCWAIAAIRPFDPFWR